MPTVNTLSADERRSGTGQETGAQVSRGTRARRRSSTSLPLAAALAGPALGACADDGEEPAALVTTAQPMTTVCEDGDTLVGIDVSKWQGDVDWAAVKADGVAFAFARVSDGLNAVDAYFADNWAGMKAAGLVRGAYQFFRPASNVADQAQLMLDMIGELGPTDLPPVLDVEADGGLSDAAVADAVDEWIEIVQDATGRRPIIYTGPYFWRDEVGGANQLPSELWVAHYGAECPLTPEPWTRWAFWQYTDSGDVAGVDGPVDTNLFNGDMAALLALTGADVTCGDGTCSAGEGSDSCPSDCPPCGVIGEDGGIVDDGDACFTAGGPQAFIRVATDAGQGGDLRWTNTTASAQEANFGNWELFLAAEGRYTVEVYTDAMYARSTRASYDVTHDGVTETVVVDQQAADGWQSLGEFDFAAGGGQRVHVGDNTGEVGAEAIAMVLDAVRLTPVNGGGGGDDDAPADGGDGASDDSDADEHDDVSAGCAAGGGDAGAPVALLLGVGAVLGRRRRR